MKQKHAQKIPVRYGMVLRLKADCLAEYKRLHADVWPEVLAAISRSHIRNYSIFVRDNTLYSYFEYFGNDFAVDMEAMASDAATLRWWALMEPMQIPFPDRASGEWWSRMEEVFHLD